jgi:hypothetical protein
MYSPPNFVHFVSFVVSTEFAVGQLTHRTTARCRKTTTPSSYFATRVIYSALSEKSLSAIILNEFKPKVRFNSTIQLALRLRYGDHIA